MGTKIAIAGKGGVGKTTTSALIIRALIDAGKGTVLALDADPNSNLNEVLGVEVEETIGKIREDFKLNAPRLESGIYKDKMIEMNVHQSLVEGKGFDLLVMGRPEGPGCYCSVNDLLRYGIDSLSREYDVTLIDCEAGPEQVSRRVVQDVHMLIIITDGSPRGMQSAGAIWGAVRTDAAMRLMKSGLVVNRCRGDRTAMLRKAHEWNIEVLGTIPEDQALSEYDAEGKPLTQLPDASLSVRATEGILARLGL